MILKKLFLIFLYLTVNLFAVTVDEETTSFDILPVSKIYVDTSRSLDIKSIAFKESEFQGTNKTFHTYGYDPDFDVWIQFTLQNTTDKTLYKMIEYDNPLTTHVDFYIPSDDILKKEGLYQLGQNRKTINPIFNIELKPHETKRIYLKVSSNITTLIVKLKLWNNDDFYEKEIEKQLILGLFFASMLILAIYNLFIYFFTLDRSYLYYVLYLVGIIAHQLIYTGVSNSYIFSHNLRITFIEYAPAVVGFPIFFLALFTKSFLKLSQYKRLNIILTSYIVFFPLIIFLLTIYNPLGQSRNIFTLILQVFLVLITIYAVYKNNRQAYFILFGWFVVMLAGSFMYFSSIGLINIDQYQHYIVEIAFVLEATIFSIALADRIKYLQIEKDKANEKLLLQQRNEQKQLRIKVEEKTQDLKNIADEKEMLLKELNHRVKNNMQTIISLIRLQLDDIDDLYVKNILSTTYNRITAMSHLHELLYYQSNISHINASEYLVLLTDEIKESYSKNITIDLDIRSDLEIDLAIYCGLIVNELTTNAFKHAFKNKSGKVSITLNRLNKKYILTVADDGVGYTKKFSSHSLGLMLVDSLVKTKLKGEINMESNNGLKIEIIWDERDE